MSAAARHVHAVPTSARAKLAHDAVVSSGLLFVNGVAPVDLENDRAPLPEMVEAQTTRVFANLDAIVAAAGLATREIVAVQVRIKDYERLFDRMNPVYLRCIGTQPLPTRSCVGVSYLTRGALVEMDFVLRA